MRLGGLSRRFGELLVRHRQRDVIRDAARQRQIALLERAHSRFDQKESSITCSRAGILTPIERPISGRDHGRERVRGFKDRQ